MQKTSSLLTYFIEKDKKFSNFSQKINFPVFRRKKCENLSFFGQPKLDYKKRKYLEKK